MDGLTVLIILICIVVYWRAETAINAFYNVQKKEVEIIVLIDEGKQTISNHVQAQQKDIVNNISTNLNTSIHRIKEELTKRQDKQEQGINEELTVLESTLKEDIKNSNNLITSHSQHIKAIDERQDEILESINMEIIPLVNAMQKRISNLEERPRQQTHDDTEPGQIFPCPECPDREAFATFEALQGHCYAKGDPRHMAVIENLRATSERPPKQKGV